eukprot:CAMPEP_0172194764 /NCGR_PEP_ID=MMETSP1050-20130122/25789_1 /TAXON_ID=233186 /ORGANISM="Cryptomonas curvata, Strain CCAP979/52" /LENGTH=41 /DNA_ID= /DNA_START= /DNA_END= /DNA_ORIENTATION=
MGVSGRGVERGPDGRARRGGLGAGGGLLLELGSTREWERAG